MNVPIFFYLTDIVILFVGIPQTLTPLFFGHKKKGPEFSLRPLFLIEY